MWEVAIAKTSILLFTSWKIIKSYFGSLVNLARSNLFQLNFIVKDVCIYGGQLKKGREKLLSIFQKAIKFDYQFSTILYSLFSDF